MRFWIREILGFLLVAAGLYFCLLSVSLITSQPSFAFSAIHTTVIGIFVFRGGIHLLKVAVAARICTTRQAPPSGGDSPPRPAPSYEGDW